METFNEAGSEIPATNAEVMENTNADNLNNLGIDRTGSFEATSGGSPFTSNEKSEIIITKAIEPVELDLMPSDAVATPTLEDFGTPLESYEVDNLNYALHESNAGIDLVISLERNGGVVDESIVAQAKSLGVSQRQIEGYISHQIHTANKVYSDSGLSFAEGTSLVRQAQNSFSDSEMKIFTNLCETSPTDAMKSLQLYFKG